VVASVGEHGGQGVPFDFLFFRGLCANLIGLLSLFPVSSYLYVFAYVYIFFI
jgi:hypothetical protein